MKRSLVFFIYLLALSFASTAQTTPNWEWGKDFNGDLISIKYHDNYLYAVGEYSGGPLNIGTTSIPNLGGRDIFISKWDTLGNLIWAYPISDTGDQRVFTLDVDGNNDIIITGYFSQPDLILNGNTYSSGGPNHCFICKMDQSGNYSWVNLINSTFLIPYLSYLNLNHSMMKVCVDNSNSIYLSSTNTLRKYNSIGTALWTKSFVSNTDFKYSSFDNKLVISSVFTGSLTVNGITVNSPAGPSYTSGVIGKSDTSGLMQWLTVIGGAHEEDNLISINQANGKIYCAKKSGFSSIPDKIFTMEEVFPNGTVGSSSFTYAGSQFPPTYYPPYSSAAEVFTISNIDSFVCVGLVYEGFKSLAIYNVNSHIVKRLYYFDNGSNKYGQALAIKSEEEVFTEGSTYTTNPTSNISHTFGKLIPGPPVSPNTHFINHYCIGTTVNLTSNIIDGVSPLSYSWAPSAGLSSTTNSSTNFVASTNTSYTLTVTDANSQVVKDTFDIIVDSSFSNLAITPQYPSFCHDSMYLYSNTGVNLNWYKFNGSSWSFFSYSSNAVINSPGLFRAHFFNSCGTFADTIQVLSAVNVAASASSTDFCVGQSTTLNGSGALTYTWTGGAINNIPINPTTTQTYTVTGTDLNGCIDTATIQIIVHPLPTITTITATPAIICTGGNSTLSLNQPISYCTPTVTNAGTTGQCITNVNFGSGQILNASGDGPGDYNYYSTTNANVIAGMNYPISISRNSSGTTAGSRTVWIDFNQDGVFDNVNEKVFFKDTSAATVIGNISIPMTVINGKTRMRIAGKWYGNATPCNIDNYGEFEDYNITISGGVDYIQWTPSTFLSTTNERQVQANNVTSTTTYTATINSVYGCTNTGTVTLTVNPTSAGTTNTTICSSDLPYLWNTLSITASGTYSDYFLNTSGCDSTATLNLTVNPTSTSTTNVIICSTSLPYVWNTQSLTSSGIYTANFTNAIGCDSTAILNLTVNPTSSSTTNATICSTSTPYVWNTQSLTASGTYTANFSNALGCDSTATLNLTVNPTSASTTNTTICSTALPYVWNTQSLTSSGIYTAHFANVFGCDSMTTLNLTVNQASASTTNVSICATALPYIWNAQAYNLSGIYATTFINAVGCDSIAELNLTVNPTSAKTTNITICSTALPYVWNTQSLTASGTYTANFTNALGCDSIASLNLTVNPTSASTTNTTICSTSLPYVWNTQSITASGMYTATFTNAVGCDSIATLNLTVNPTSASTTDITICSTALPYSWNSQTLTASGTYSENLSNALGCDSIATLNLIVNPTSASTTDITICSTSLPYVWNTQSITASGIYTSTFTNALGCDSITTLNLIVNPTSASTTDITICSTSLPYVWNTQSITASGMYTATFTNALGCDSVATLNLSVNSTSASTTDITICASSLPYSWNSQTLTTSGIYTETFSNSYGCDSIATLSLIVNPLPFVAITPYTDSTICIGTSYVLHVDTSYSAYTWTWNGNIVSSNDSVLVDSSGTYIVSCTDSNGCFALDTVNVIILPSPQPNIIQNNYTLTCTNTSNVNYQWYFNGTAIGTNDSVLTITQDGQYIVKITDSAGCIGFDTLTVIGLGIQGISSNENISIYPNPSSELIQIEVELNESSPLDLKLFDAQGRVVWMIKYEEKTSGKYNEHINLKSLGLKPGVYLLTGRTLSNQWTKRVVYIN